MPTQQRRHIYDAAVPGGVFSFSVLSFLLPHQSESDNFTPQQKEELDMSRYGIYT